MRQQIRVAPLPPVQLRVGQAPSQGPWVWLSIVILHGAIAELQNLKRWILRRYCGFCDCAQNDEVKGLWLCGMTG